MTGSAPTPSAAPGDDGTLDWFTAMNRAERRRFGRRVTKLRWCAQCKKRTILNVKTGRCMTCNGWTVRYAGQPEPRPAAEGEER